MFGRREVKTHGQLVRDELSEGFGHLRQAAAYAAGGVGAAVGPKLDSAKEHLPHQAERMRDAAAHGWDSTTAAFAPLVEAARTGAMNATKKAQKASRKARKKESRMARKRTAILVGLLTVGAAVGAAGAIIARRRNRASWQEYEAQGIDAARDYPTLDPMRTAADQGAERVEPAATGEAANRSAEQGTEAATRATDLLEQGKTDEFPEKAHTISKNTRG